MRSTVTVTVTAVHVLFICTGNICRSPTAERLLRAYAAEGGHEVTASSAGTHGLVGHPMDPTAATVLQQLGGESDGFVARRISARIAEDADIVLAMTARHRDEVLAIAPRSRCWKLPLWSTPLARGRSRRWPMPARVTSSMFSISRIRIGRITAGTRRSGSRSRTRCRSFFGCSDGTDTASSSRFLGWAASTGLR